MKKLSLNCPKCKSNNVHRFNSRNVTMFDEEFYNMLIEEFGEQAETGDSFVAECKCNNCNSFFSAKISIQIEVTNIEYCN